MNDEKLVTETWTMSPSWVFWPLVLSSYIHWCSWFMFEFKFLRFSKFIPLCLGCRYYSWFIRFPLCLQPLCLRLWRKIWLTAVCWAHLVIIHLITRAWHILLRNSRSYQINHQKTLHSSLQIEHLVRLGIEKFKVLAKYGLFGIIARRKLLFSLQSCISLNWRT